MTKSLGEALDEQLSRSPLEQLQLAEEVALLREVAGNSVSMYAIAKQAYEDQPTAARLSMVGEAGALMQHNLRQVIAAVESNARISSAPKDQLPIGHIAIFLQQIVACIHKSLGGNVEQAEKIVAAIRAGVMLPENSSIKRLGTTITPDQVDEVVVSMDDSIPHISIPTNGVNGHASSQS